MNYGIVDLGSNTIHLNVYQIEDKHYEKFLTKKYMASLAAYIDHGVLSTAGINKLEETLTEIQYTLSQIKVDRVYIFATASLRKVTNGLDIIHNIKERTGMEIELLSQLEEAELGYLGIRQIFDRPEGISVDIGGGSTEIVEFSHSIPSHIINIAEGSLSLYTEYVKKILPNKKEMKTMRRAIREKLNTEPHPQYTHLIGIGGTIRAVGKLAMEIFNLDSDSTFTIDQLSMIYDSFKEKDRTTLQALLKVKPERIHTFVPGMLILLECCKAFGIEEVLVCQAGVREGYLLSKLNA